MSQKRYAKLALKPTCIRLKQIHSLINEKNIKNEKDKVEGYWYKVIVDRYKGMDEACRNRDITEFV